MSLSRIPKSTQADIKIVFYLDGVATNATGTPSITVTKEDGTTLVSGSATAQTGVTGGYYFTLTPTHTANLDFLTATWTGVFGSVNQSQRTFHEVVGDHLVTIAEMRAMHPLEDTTNYSTDKLALMRDLASYTIEQACNCGLTTHYGRETVLGTGTSYLPLRGTVLQSVESITVNGTTVDSTTYFAHPGGSVQRLRAIWPDETLIVVRYTEGRKTTGPEVGRAVAKLAAHYLFEDRGDGGGSGIPERATFLADDGANFRLVTAGFGVPTDIPEVNSVIERWRVPW